MKFKDYKSEVVDVVEKGIVTIAISRLEDEDMGGDIVHKGAFQKTFKEGSNRIKHYLDHLMKQAYNVGLPVKMYETETHAVVESALNLEKQIARDLFADYKFFNAHGKSLTHSFGYLTVKGKARERGEDIFEVKMFEYSTVGVSMHPETPLLDMKSFDDYSLLEDYLRKYDVSNTKGKAIEEIIAKIKALKEPSKDTPENNPEPAKPLTKRLNEVLTTKNIF